MRVQRPHLEIVETTRTIDAAPHREVRWVTDRGELTESFVGEWQRERLVKRPDDYRILHRAFEGIGYTADSAAFLASEAAIGDGGITLGTLGWTPLRRTPLLQVQIDFAGPERFALDVADRVPPLMDLLDLLGHLTLQKFREAVKTPARYIKLWENLSIDMLGVRAFREQVVPMYGRILEILEPAGKELLVHYDGKLRVIAGDIAALPLHIDSFTPSLPTLTSSAARVLGRPFLKDLVEQPLRADQFDSRPPRVSQPAEPLDPVSPLHRTQVPPASTANPWSTSSRTRLW
ncbi:MAG: hypothetical protein HUU20_16435 [Pirellulales bacterium]|nr:hypothetical protein [Pirellulales bacterium]